MRASQQHGAHALRRIRLELRGIGLYASYSSYYRFKRLGAVTTYSRALHSSRNLAHARASRVRPPWLPRNQPERCRLLRLNIATRCPKLPLPGHIPALDATRASFLRRDVYFQVGTLESGRSRSSTTCSAGDAVLADAGEVGAPAPSTHAPAPTGTFGRRRPNPKHRPCACPHEGRFGAPATRIVTPPAGVSPRISSAKCVVLCETAAEALAQSDPVWLVQRVVAEEMPAVLDKQGRTSRSWST